jgi:cellulose synthase/poly-beta-1,6-N-acetylglucosamine synthase-like glycosyltransferase
MGDWFEILLLLCALLLLLPVLILAAEVAAALLPSGTSGASRPSGFRCVVLVPAHDEEAGIKTTLTSIQEQLEPQDRILVIADNCTDGTAMVARAAGADVVERADANRRGKGFALDCGTRALESNPPDVVVILDADCLLRPGALGQLVAMAVRTARPAQAVYCLEPPAGAGSLTQLSAFAFLFKNLVRPRGLARLGFPCLLTGSGMAFPWQVLRSAPLASGNIVEDMQLGLDLALAGHPPQLCAEARVDGVLPSGRDAAYRQRTRWEHGHLRTLLTQVPRLLGSAVRRGRLDLLALALELSVPPLSVLGLLYIALFCLWLIGQPTWPGLVLGGAALTAMVAFFAAWTRFGTKYLPFTSLLAAPFYVLAKVPIYLFFAFRPQKAWVRTLRDPLPPPAV